MTISSEEREISERTLQRKIEEYVKAESWALKMGEVDGKNYEYMKILAMCPKERKKSKTYALNDEMKVLIENIWFDKDFAMNLCKYAKLYRIFCEEGMKKGWSDEELPSYSTVIR